MLSSHSVKRFLKSFTIPRALQFRKILHMLFIWRLKKQKPEKIILGLDTMVMDNDDALMREGVDPTYKKVKGFQPIHLYWGRFIIDTILRNGKAHSNHGNNVKRIIVNAVRLIRKHYSREVPIVLLADTGFFDEAIFKLCNELNIGFIIGGRMYSDIKETVAKTSDESFHGYKIGKRLWYFLDFTDSRGNRDTAYRCIYTKPISDKAGQILLEFDRPESILYTNLGMENEVSRKLMMTIAFFLFESFKSDMNNESIPVTWYPSTFRRRFINAAGKIVYHGRRITLKLTALFFSLFNLPELRIRSVSLNPVLII